MRKYKISEVASILQLSSGMIRYFERCGAIRPVRGEENQYRTFTYRDISELIELMQIREWGIKVREFSDIKKTSSEELLDRLRTYRQQVKEEIRYLQVMNERLISLSERLESLPENVNRVRVRQVPERCAFEYARIDDLGEGEIVIEPRNARFLFSEKVIPFLNAEFVVDGPEMKWLFSIKAEYFKELDRPDGLRYETIPEKKQLCAIWNVAPENVDRKAFYREMAAEMEAQGMPVCFPMRGRILFFGYGKQEYGNYMEMYLSPDEERL